MMKRKCNINLSNLYLVFARSIILGAAVSTPIFPGAMALSFARSSIFRRGCIAKKIGSTEGWRGSIASLGTEDAARKSLFCARQPFHPFASPVCFSSVDHSSNANGVESYSDSIKMKNANRKNKVDKDWSSYEKLVRKLYMTNLFNPVKLGLENMHKLHEAFGSPMDQVRIPLLNSFSFYVLFSRK